MSPEQVSADPNLDHRSDIYALGLIAYEMLAGTFAVRGTHGAVAVFRPGDGYTRAAAETTACIARCGGRTHHALSGETSGRPTTAGE